MKINAEILQKWQNLRSRGDSIKIADSSGYHCQTIQKVLNSGECASIEVFEAIASYYDDKAEILNQYID